MNELLPNKNVIAEQDLVFLHPKAFFCWQSNQSNDKDSVKFFGMFS